MAKNSPIGSGSASLSDFQSHRGSGKNFATIHVVDDDASFRRATCELLVACGYRTLPHGSAKQFLETPLTDESSCILLDVRMAGLSGPQLQSHLANLGSMIPIIFISGHGDISTTVQTIKAGAEDFLTKPVRKEKLLEVIERALTRYEKNRINESQVRVLNFLFMKLTAREREVFIRLVHGKLHKQIACELGISERTVKLHRHEIVQKLEARSLAELAIIAERLGLLASVAVNGAEGMWKKAYLQHPDRGRFHRADVARRHRVAD